MRPGRVLAALGLLLLSSSCGSGSADPEPTASHGVAGVERVAGGVRLSDGALAALRADLSDYEAGLLSDKVLTLADFESAFFESVRCVEELGYTVTDVRPPSWISPGSFGARYPGAANPLLELEFRDCKFEYITEFSLIWGSVYGPSEQQIVEARQAFTSCLRNRGVDLPRDGAPDELMRDFGYRADFREAFPGCHQAVTDAYGFLLR